MPRLFLTLILTLFSAASAAQLVVHPFQASDPVLGTALAQRVADAFGSEAIGPGATPALLAPLVAPSGFVTPAVFVDDPALAGRNAAWLLRGVAGTRAALTGSLSAVADDLVLRLELDLAGAERRATLRGERSDPGALADRAARVVAAWLDLDPVALPPFSITGPDGDRARALSLIAAGLPRDALAALAQADRPDDVRVRALAELLEAVLTGSDGAHATTSDAIALQAVIALNAGDLDSAADHFAALARAGVSVGDVWSGVIAHNGGDAAAAQAAFERAARPDYPTGLAARAAYRYAVGDSLGAQRDLDRLASDTQLSAAAALLGLVAANLGADPQREDALAARLERAAPFLTFSFERRSFIAFDRDDALAAAQALAVATLLDPDSDLYWTNYGWALYLLGFLERSEAASRRAIDLDAQQYIARYNLGLVLVVTDRLDEALGSYREALRFDPAVDDEAVADLVAAEALYPEAVGVPFARALLEAARGERGAAADAYERYVAAASERPDHPAVSAARVREASERAAALRAPLPPIEIEEGIELRLGRRGPSLDALRPGDPLVVRFEVTTRGDALPGRLDLNASLVDADGVRLVSVERRVDVPSGAIGFVVEVVRLELPDPLDAGSYRIEVAAAGDGLSAQASRQVDVSGASQVVRALIGRDVTLLALETEQALYSPRDVQQSDVVVARLVAELRAAAPIAEEVLPTIASGRFAGRSGGDAFAESSEEDVIDFLRFVLSDGSADSSFTFVDGYAEWVLQGAP